MEKYFDDSLLETFAETFYGYGNYNGPYWFIGMEEGGGDSFDQASENTHGEAGRNAVYCH